MRCETARRMMMDRLYESLSTEKGKMLDAHLNTCAACAAEWDDVQSAHAFMKYLPEKNIPIHLQQAVLEQSQSEALPPLSESSSHHLWRWAAAAAFIMAIGISYSNWNTTPPKHNHDAALASPDLNELTHKKLDETLKKTEQIIHRSTLPTQLQTSSEKVDLITQNVTRSEPQTPSVETVALAPKKIKTQNADELFRTGLNTYNLAFTKLGSERDTLLRSAILILNDLDDFPSDARQWIAMGMILKADSFRVLNDPDRAIATYQQMTERFTDLPNYSQEARASIIKLMLERNSENNRIEEQLVKYQETTPQPIEFASLALAYSEKVFSSSPVAALLWSKRVIEALPERHPMRDKAFRDYREFSEKALDAFYVQDWKIVGPFPGNTVESNDEFKTDPFSFLAKKANRNKSIRLVERKPNGDAVIDIAQLLQQTPADSCAFAQTYVFSPTARNVLIRIGFSDGLRVMLNGDPISGGVDNRNFQRDALRIFCTLNQGWNSLFVKSFHQGDDPEWKFCLFITDKEGNHLPDLQYDSSRSKRTK